MVLDVFFVYISLLLNMPEKHTGILNPGMIVWEVALLYNLFLRSVPFKISIRNKKKSFILGFLISGWIFLYMNPSENFIGNFRETLYSWICHFWKDFPLCEFVLKFH